MFPVPFASFVLKISHLFNLTQRHGGTGVAFASGSFGVLENLVTFQPFKLFNTAKFLCVPRALCFLCVKNLSIYPMARRVRNACGGKSVAVAVLPHRAAEAEAEEVLQIAIPLEAAEGGDF